MGVIGIKYREFGDPLDYESVCIHTTLKGEIIFDSGNFVKDWYDAIKKFITELTENLSHSSSCDHFISDGAKFDSAYLHIIDDKPILKYLNKSNDNWINTEMDVYENGIEFFVKEGTTPTWKELKEMCEQNIK